MAATIVAALCTTQVAAQAPAAPSGAAAPATAEELETLVSRIALYPDDLIAIILPAATNPLQLVQADRFLDKRKSDPKAPVDEKWDDPIKALLNYPEIVRMMSRDLDWTVDLGEAVVADSAEVLEAIQAFRRRAQAAGNLKTDDKQVVVVEKSVVTIVPADPQVVYVPQYNPTTVIVAGAYPTYAYYPPYPAYWYPYPPGAAFATGLIWGAAIGAAWGGHYTTHWGGGGNNTINIDRNTNINVDRSRTNVGSGSRPSPTSSQWKSNKQPGQVSNAVGRTPSASTRVGDPGRGATGARPSTQPAAGVGGDRGTAGARPSTQPAGGAGAAAARPSQQPAGGAFDGYGSGRQTQMDSTRGAASVGSMGAAPSGGARPSPSAGARPSPSAGARPAPSMGGGARGGGGGGRGGRR
jgi:hypothetical protein